MTKNIKLLAGALLLGGSVLLLGATGIRGAAVMDEVRSNQERCSAAAAQMTPVVPENSRDGWTGLVRKSPELCIRAGHTALRPVTTPAH